MELKPCPFCGEPCEGKIQHGTEDREGWPVNVICTNCGATGPWNYAANEHDTLKAFEDWNNRPEVARLAARVQELEEFREFVENCGKNFQKCKFPTCLDCHQDKARALGKDQGT